MCDKMTKVEIFWTGGFDSTFRMVQLSRMPVVIQPIYLSGTNWRESEKYELRAISRIYDILKNHSETKAVLLSIRLLYGGVKEPDLSMIDSQLKNIFEISVMQKDREVVKAWRKLYIKVNEINRQNGVVSKAFDRLSGLNNDLYLAEQYISMASYANTTENVEIAFVKTDAAELNLMTKFGQLTQLGNGNYAIDPSLSEEELFVIFGHTSFPLFGYTKHDLKEMYAEMKCDEILKLTWFCYTPINDESCGQCWTCLHTYRDGIDDRFSPDALERYKRRIAELEA